MTSPDHDEKNHVNHLCEVSRKDIKEFDRLTRDPQYKCANCGRVANKAENLCSPRPLTEKAKKEFAHDEKNHANHLCEVFVKNNPEYEALTKDPKYRCANCGREAHYAKNLCSPRLLK